MKSLTTYITEQIKDWLHASEVCRDFCEAGAWTHAKVGPGEVEDIVRDLKDYDFMAHSTYTKGPAKIALGKAQNLIQACLNKKNVKKAYDEWKDSQSGAYWYQGYPRKESYGYIIEAALIVSMGIYLDLGAMDWYKTTDLSYEQLKTKFLNNKFQKEMLASFKK